MLEFFENAKVIITFLGSLITFTTILIGAVKPLRNKFIQWIINKTGSNNMVSKTELTDVKNELSSIKTMLSEHIQKDKPKATEIQNLQTTVGELKTTVDGLDKTVGKLNTAVDGMKCQLATVEESEQCVQRTNILRIYYKYLPDGEIPAYEFETLSKDYHSYKKLKGNTFVDDIWRIMSEEWKVIPNGNYK